MRNLFLLIISVIAAVACIMTDGPSVSVAMFSFSAGIMLMATLHELKEENN